MYKKWHSQLKNDLILTILVAFPGSNPRIQIAPQQNAIDFTL